MADVQSIRFNINKISTDEFAMTEEKYDPAIPAEIKIGLGFNFARDDRIIVVQVKCMFYQQDKLLIVIAVSCWFMVDPEDWQKIYLQENKTFELSLPIALHLASLTVGTARGVLHAKTEKHILNAVLIPPVNLNEIIKEGLKIPVNE